MRYLLVMAAALVVSAFSTKANAVEVEIWAFSEETEQVLLNVRCYMNTGANTKKTWFTAPARLNTEERNVQFVCYAHVGVDEYRGCSRWDVSRNRRTNSRIRRQDDRIVRVVMSTEPFKVLQSDRSSITYECWGNNSTIWR